MDKNLPYCVAMVLHLGPQASASFPPPLGNRNHAHGSDMGATALSLLIVDLSQGLAFSACTHALEAFERRKVP